MYEYSYITRSKEKKEIVFMDYQKCSDPLSLDQQILRGNARLRQLDVFTNPLTFQDALRMAAVSTSYMSRADSVVVIRERHILYF